jgi:hypothetical protein
MPRKSCGAASNDIVKKSVLVMAFIGRQKRSSKNN